MADIFISYASEDRPRAKALAGALVNQGWSVWWDREIPIGKSFDEVIEQALHEAKCVIVLWSAVSIASDWVRNEASEGKSRRILVPVFLEKVQAPLAFRFLNGADLSDWRRGPPPTDEFDRLIKCVNGHVEQPQGRKPPPVPPRWRGFAIGGAALLIVVVALLAYKMKGPEPGNRPAPTPSFTPAPTEPPSPVTPTIGFYSKPLGIRMTFVTPDQTFGLLPSGALVSEVEDGPAAKAGVHAGDVIAEINGNKIVTADDLRQSIRKIGPGKSSFTLRNGNDIRTVTVDCPKC